MSVAEIIGLILALLLMGGGLVGSVVPGLPGTPVVFLVAILHRLYFGAASASTFVLILLGVLTAISILLDILASALGAKRFGATWRGAVGAVIGGTIGLFFALPGIILGPFIGATLFEMFGDKEYKEAMKAGAGAVIGLFLGVIGKFVICVIMIALFATNTVYRTMTAPPADLPAANSAAPANINTNTTTISQ